MFPRQDSKRAEHDNQSIYIDVLAQQARLNRLYTQLTYCFRLADDSQDTETEIVRILQDGLGRLGGAFPWVSGCVIQDGDVFKIEIRLNEPHLSVKDFHHVTPEFTWNELQKANFPYRLLDEGTIASLPTFVSEDTHPAPLPVLLVQANFITGGLLLTFNAQHGSMDIAGQAEVIRLFAKACRNESFTDHELRIGNMSRENLIPLLANEGETKEKEPIKEPSPYERRILETSSAPSPPIWAYIAFTADALTQLKASAMEGIAEGTFVSTDDALSAFIWQSITLARRSRLSPSQVSTTLSRNVDVRRLFSIPATYPGFAVHSTTHTLNVAELLQSSLSAVALGLRRALDPASLRHSTQQLATSIHHLRDAGASAKKPDLEVRLSSWAKEDCYNHNFGPELGKPTYVRRPQFMNGAREGLVYFLPKSPNGEILVGICLRREDLQRLREDNAVMKYGSYIG